MQLSQRYNRYRPTTQTQTITDGSYQFDELFAAVKLASLKTIRMIRPGTLWRPTCPVRNAIRISLR